MAKKGFLEEVVFKDTKMAPSQVLLVSLWPTSSALNTLIQKHPFTGVLKMAALNSWKPFQ